MRLFDLHADTASRMLFEDLPFESPLLSLSCNDISVWESLTQVFACFSPPSLGDEDSFAHFFLMRDRLYTELKKADAHRLEPLLSVEDARLLAGQPERVSLLAKSNVRILTLLWRGTTCIGGAYDTEEGLTPFGKRALTECLTHGILPDVSHASVHAFYDIAEFALSHATPLLATHSNAYGVCRHPRNLTDAQFAMIRDSGGIVGISLCREHLNEDGNAKIHDIIRHIEHYLSLGGQAAIAIGSDLDGITHAPHGIKRNRDLLKIAEEMERLGYPCSLIQNLFYKNADNFFGKYIKR